jgi:hypothetical protein
MIKHIIKVFKQKLNQLFDNRPARERIKSDTEEAIHGYMFTRVS